MTKQAHTLVLIFALLLSPFFAFAETLEEVPSTPEEQPLLEEGEVGEILATSTIAVLEETVETAKEIRIAEIEEELRESEEYVDGEVIVVLKEQEDVLAVQEMSEEVETLSENVVLISTDESLAEVIAELEEDKDVLRVEPNYVRSIGAWGTTSDPYADELWGLTKIEAPFAWASSTGEDVLVALLDTGIDYTHEDLVGALWDGTNCVDSEGVSIVGGCVHGWDFVDDDNDPYATAIEHGTHVAGTIASRVGNTVGIAGTAPNVTLMSLRIMNDTGNGSVSSEVEAIHFAIQNGADIINASYAGNGFSQTERDAIEAFEAAGGIFITAAGNDGRNTDTTPSYPASHSLNNIISVAATDEDDLLTSFSNFGAVSVDVGAPGTSIVSTTPDNSYAYAEGTSMATPHVTGIVALLHAFRPSLGMTDIKRIVLESGDIVDDLADTSSGRRVNAYNALQTAELETRDTTPPTIVLNGANPLVLALSQPYNEPGATATDDRDGDISAFILITGNVNTEIPDTYLITYTVSDSVGNETIATRTVEVTEDVAPEVDTTPPSITLNGANPLQLSFAQPYEEPGATAYDETDGDVTEAITIDGSINTENAGTYTITYRVSDLAGNVATATRTVEVAGRSRPRGGGGGGGGSKKDDPVRSIQSGIVLGATTPYLFESDLGNGASGEEVRMLQKTLKDFGYFFGMETGTLDSATSEALRVFQASRGLPQTGILDSATRASLNQLSTLLAYLYSELARLIALLTA